MMKVSFIGSGNVATVLAKQMFCHGYTIIQVFSKHKHHALELAEKVGASAIDDLRELDLDADVYIIAVGDKIIEQILSQLNLKDKLVVHTAGAVSLNILQTVSNNYGVLYPVQTLRKEMNSEVVIPFMIDGNNSGAIHLIENIATNLQQSYVYGGDEQRLKIHVAAVFASNFVNYLYYLSADFCTKEQLDFNLLLPIIEETATRLKLHHPKDVFTGPAIRGDENTINAHLKLLTDYAGLQKLYASISEQIQQLSLD